MLLEIRPISGNRKDLESVVTEIALHLRCIDSMRPPGIKCVLNLGDISFVPNRPAPLTKPVLPVRSRSGWRRRLSPVPGQYALISLPAEPGPKKRTLAPWRCFAASPASPRWLLDADQRDLLDG